jgi:hypothetical protein
MIQFKILALKTLLLTCCVVLPTLAVTALAHEATTAQIRTATNFDSAVAGENSRTASNSGPTESTESRTATTESRTATNSASDIQQLPANSASDIQQLQRYFFAAARTGEQAVLQEFLSAGYPVNARNEQSYTALMIAAYAGQAQAVAQLLQAGADACLRDKRGHTALMGAMIKAEWDIARTLYNIDCDKENTAKVTDVVTDKNQMTAAQFAQVFGQSEKFKALNERVQRQP